MGSTQRSGWQVLVTFPFLVQDTFNDHYYIYKIMEPLRILYKSESNILLMMASENSQTLFEQHQFCFFVPNHVIRTRISTLGRWPKHTANIINTHPHTNTTLPLPLSNWDLHKRLLRNLRNNKNDLTKHIQKIGASLIPIQENITN